MTKSSAVSMTVPVQAKTVPHFIKFGKGYASVLLAALLLCGWQWLVEGLEVSPLIMAKPTDVAVTLWNGLSSGFFWPHIGTTVYETVAGFIGGALLGVICATIMTEWPGFGKIIYPYFAIIQCLPKVAVAPLIVMWMGFGIESKVLVVVLNVFFPVLVSTVSGLSVQDSMRNDLMRSLMATRWQNFLYVRLPSAATQIFSGLNVGLVLALTGAIVAEFVGAQSGLGVLLLQSGSNLDTASLFAVLVILTVIGLVLSLSIMALERRVVYWVDRRNGE
jgi:NitT/TauT family transport system permease protein